MLFIEYPKCSTCQKARKWLEGYGAAFTVRHIKNAPPTAGELRLWQKCSGLPLKKFFNTSGLKYKELLASDGMLVKRPILVGDDFVLVGFREAEWSRALGKK